MFVTPLFYYGLKSWIRIAGWGLCLGQGLAWSQVVPSQANLDASAQRRLLETAREGQRQHRIEKEIRTLSSALAPEQLPGPQGPVLTRKALAALSRLRGEGVLPEEALARAARLIGCEGRIAAKPAAYLRNLFMRNSGALTPSVIRKLDAGEDPTPAFSIPPYQP